MCEVRLKKIVSSKPGNWVRCTLAKLVISSHFEASDLIIHTEKLFSYHEIYNGLKTVERVTQHTASRLSQVIIKRSPPAPPATLPPSPVCRMFSSSITRCRQSSSVSEGNWKIMSAICRVVRGC